MKDVNALVETGEFVAILGHSGCGKSTVLSIVAGLDTATFGGVVIDGTQVDGPGAERAIVFQSPCLLPWLTARQNVELGASQGTVRKTRREIVASASHYLELVGVADAADQLPPQISLGTQQCVSLARALAVEPRFLLLDEPFSQLDSLTRFDLQDILLRVWERSGKTVVMVTHDVDEALYLADRLDSHDRWPGSVRRRDPDRAVSQASLTRRRARAPALPRVPASGDRLPRAPRAPVTAQRARRRARVRRAVGADLRRRRVVVELCMQDPTPDASKNGDCSLLQRSRARSSSDAVLLARCHRMRRWRR